MQRSLFTRFAVAVSIITAMCLPGSAPGADNTQALTIGYMPIGDCLQLYVADSMGFLKEEGITIEKKSMKGGAVIAPAVEAGEIQIGWSNTISIILAHTKGFDFTFLTSGALEKEGGHRVHSLLVGKESPIKTVTDLKGKKVAINTLGNINDLSMIALADANQVNIKDISLVEVPFPQMEAALKNGSVDAILAVEPFVTLSVSHGTARYLEKSVHKSFGDEFMIGGWFAKKSWIAENPALVAAFVRAINKASDYIVENPQKMPEILVSHTKLTADLAAQITLPAFSSELKTADLQKMIDVSAHYGFIKAPFPAQEIIHQ